MITLLPYPTQKEVDHAVHLGRPAVFDCYNWVPDGFGFWSLAREFKNRKVLPVVQNTPRLEWDPTAGLPRQVMEFNTFLEHVVKGPKEGVYAYVQDNVDEFQELAGISGLPYAFGNRDILRTKLWISGHGPITPLHYDPVETFHWVLKGSKEFVVYPPGVRNYYPHPVTSTAPFISKLDPQKYNHYRYPRFKNAEPLRITVESGTMLYLPAFWWHEVKSVNDFNVSLNYVWWARWARNLRNLPQFARCFRHLHKQLKALR